LSADVSILFVLKSNDKLYLYIDYRNLNIIIIKNCYLLFLITETLDCLYETKYFIVLNLKNVYYCIRIKRNNKYKIAFRTRYRYFEYQIMLFELANAFAIF